MFPAGERSLAFAARCCLVVPLLRERIMFGIGHWELIVVVLVIFILFGHRLPSVMRSMGRGIVEFKEGMKGVDADTTDKVEKRDV